MDLWCLVVGETNSKTSRQGETRASVLSVFLKNVVFAIAKLLIHAPKLAQNSPGF